MEQYKIYYYGSMFHAQIDLDLNHNKPQSLIQTEMSNKVHSKV